MTIEDSIYAALTGASAVTNIVSTRVYPDVTGPDEAPPYVTYQRISTPRDHAFGGNVVASSPRFQIDCWAATKDVTTTLAEAVINAMDGVSGVKAHTIDNDISDWDQTSRLYRRMVDVILVHVGVE